MTKLPKKNKQPILSVIILNFNSGDYLSKCLTSLYQSVLKNYQIEVIVVDNASTDNSLSQTQTLKLENPNILPLNYLPLPSNIGFSAGNNRGISISNPQSPYVLFLNPDTTLQTDTLQVMIDHFQNDPQVHAATCFIELASTGQLQPESHRGFPTPWNTFWHFFGFGLPKLFPKSALLNGYLMNHLDYSQPQLLDCCVGAFLMVRRSVGQQINWWDEQYFFYGEDLDFCFQLRKNNFHLYFFPDTKIIHYQGVSSGIISQTKKISSANRHTKIMSAKASTQAMKIFVSKNLINQYPAPLRWLVLFGIKLLEIQRYLKARFL